jgi:hypothetical protein
VLTSCSWVARAAELQDVTGTNWDECQRPVWVRSAQRITADQEQAVKLILTLVVVAWLVIGAFAALQRGYFGDKRDVNCKTAGDTALTIVAGPTNYVGINPKINCRVPEPSK